MRHSIFYASAALLALAACKKDEPKLETLVLEPATAEVITDEVLPELKLTAVPEGILEGKTILGHQTSLKSSQYPKMVHSRSR